MKKVKKISTKHKNELLNALTKAARDHELLDSFLRDLLTPIEYQDVVYRWQIVQRLTRGESQRRIADELGLGIATITRGSRELKNKHGGFNTILKNEKHKATK